MSLWGNTQNQTAAPKSTTYTVDRIAGKNVTGTGNSATATSVAVVASITSYNNTSIGAFSNNIAVGTFAVSAAEARAKNGNTSGQGVGSQGAGGPGVAPGWINVRFGTGPVVGATVATSNATVYTTNFANGETAVFSNGTSNAILAAVTNATGNLVALTVSSPGSGFANVAQGVIAFRREKHLGSIAVTSNATAIGYNNTDLIIASNGITNAVATLTTNATGGITATTVTNPGLFGNTAANATVVFSVTNATGGATTGNVVSTVFAANLVSSSNTGAQIAVQLGGRAGRVQYEALAIVKNMGNNAPSTLFPG